MARIAGINLPPQKKVKIGLTYIFGIGPTTVKKILNKTNVDGEKRVKDLSDKEIDSLKSHIENTYRVEGDLRRDVSANIKRLKEISSYRGSRHAKHLPVRGQRTKTNSRTVRGNVRHTMGSGRRAVTKG
ncbi:MAG: 30S ribosomal protein S13 [Patescibacteria group bacterium]|nr:30S ribosomal protein S13 [Patescibacteria group bacterium]MDD5121384.1 30S ribosomal protein S13 [Patescibacteria group bacterium]MDD5221791.1 30S ribosomal protein S13 [Patescibacteria group bacterium]MDD5395697.1 30S ribosomal protein S13 [Patescibacteria group bacterium]